MRTDEQNVSRVLAAIDERPATIRSVALRAGLPRRRVEEAIEAIRKAGAAPVCSGPEGVWIARSVREYEGNVDARRRRALGQLVTVRGERRLLRRLATPGQATIW